MLEQTGVGRNWVAGDLERPFGRGLNLQVTVSDVRDIEYSLNEACYPLFMPTESKWYRISDNEEAGVRQFVVADPDGYLVRFQESLGHRSTASCIDVEKGDA
ncbi:VOC family protein [Brevibacterium siliguriense]|uniref:hypothetical protein n=1 Tax=Brevibacterium siliguriense TaxID=1136497 RepID=UPI0018D33E04|nr:hypothetical protein [Brevibacterium siliguriense]